MATWLPFIGALICAVVAGRYAVHAKAAEFQASRVLELERRLAEAKAEIFVPMIEALGTMFDLTAAGKGGDRQAFEKSAGPQLRRFIHWVQVYGADETVRVVHRFQQALYHDPPPEVVLRLTAELIVAARRELGNPDTTVTAVEVMGIRLTDTYEKGEPLRYLSISEHELYAEVGWTPPWGDRYRPALPP